MRFELTIDGYLRTTASTVSGEHLSVLQRLLIVLPRRERLGRPVVHHLSAGAHRLTRLGHSPLTRISNIFSILNSYRQEIKFLGKEVWFEKSGYKYFITVDMLFVGYALRNATTLLISSLTRHKLPSCSFTESTNCAGASAVSVLFCLRSLSLIRFLGPLLRILVICAE